MDSDYECDDELQDGAPRWEQHISALPDELIIHVFTFLDLGGILKSSKVCAQWRRIAKDDRIWRQVDLASYSVSIVIGLLHELPLENLNFSGSRFMTDSIFSSLMQHFSPNLRSLNLNNCSSLTNSIANCLPRRVTSTIRAKNSDSDKDKDNSSDNGSTTPALSALQYLNLSETKLGAPVIRRFLETCCDTLTELDLSQCKFPCGSTFNNLAFPRLRKLVLRRCNQVDQKFLDSIHPTPSSFPALEHLDLRECNSTALVYSTVPSLLSRFSSQITGLDLIGMHMGRTINVPKILQIPCTNLVSLSLSASIELADVALLGESLGRTLQFLHLRGDWLYHCRHLRSDSVLALCIDCKALKSLVLESFFIVAGDAPKEGHEEYLQSFAAQRMAAAGQMAINNGGMCAQFTKLALKHIRTEHGVVAAMLSVLGNGAWMHHVSHLELTDITELNDEILSRLTQSCSNHLTHLHLEYAYQCRIAMSTIQQIRAQCKKLTKVIIPVWHYWW
eukprot:GEZU01032657.1.p1 GENE.GEZU01032657.1~~GEZU01032657.1.p1  ORF type:complete len:504 (-),score=73.48 GEZU01032657.1:230-1741(-)